MNTINGLAAARPAHPGLDRPAAQRRPNTATRHRHGHHSAQPPLHHGSPEPADAASATCNVNSAVAERVWADDQTRVLSIPNLRTVTPNGGRLHNARPRAGGTRET